MTTFSKSLAIFTLFAVLWLENKAHHCGSRHEKTHKKIEKGKTSTKTSTAAPTSTKQIKVNNKCNIGTVPSCQCGIDYDSKYYPVPKSGNCNDVFKRLSTTPADYHFREENCSKVQRTVCKVDSSCDSIYDYRIIDDQQFGTPPPTPDNFLISQNTSKPFCMCGYDGGNHPIPKSGNCADLDLLDVIKKFLTTPIYNERFGFVCLKARTVCKCTNYCECKEE